MPGFVLMSTNTLKVGPVTGAGCAVVTPIGLGGVKMTIGSSSAPPVYVPLATGGP